MKGGRQRAATDSAVQQLRRTLRALNEEDREKEEKAREEKAISEGRPISASSPKKVAETRGPVSRPGSAPPKPDERPAWDGRHHLMFSCVNDIVTSGERDYFDRPRDLRIKVPEGHDGISEPFERVPSLNYLHMSKSPKFAKTRPRSGSGGSQAVTPTNGSPPRSATTRKDETQSPNTTANTTLNRTKSSMPECGVGSPYGSDTKPEWMKTGSWNTAVEKRSPDERRALGFARPYSSQVGSAKHIHMKKGQYRLKPGLAVVIQDLEGLLAPLNNLGARVMAVLPEGQVAVTLAEVLRTVGGAEVLCKRHGERLEYAGPHAASHGEATQKRGRLLSFDQGRYTVRMKGEIYRLPITDVGFVMSSEALRVPWNNRSQLLPLPSLHISARETFASPSRSYTAETEAWRHMYGDGCEQIATRKPGLDPPHQQPVYGWQALRLQKKPKARTGSGFCHVGELDEGPREEWAPPAEEPVWESVAAAEKD